MGVGLEVGIVLGHHQQARQRAGQLALRLLELGEGFGSLTSSGVAFMPATLARAWVTWVSTSFSCAA